MEEPTEKKGLIKKFFSILSGKPTEEEASPTSSGGGKFAPSSKEPVDLTFVKNFTASGGKFLYCENEKDTYSFLQNILGESSINAVYCDDENLKSILKSAQLPFSETLSDADAFCCDCEYLISFNGGIMISEHQTKGKKLIELPHIFITIAKTSQIVENLRSGLTGIRSKYKQGIPSQITTIKGPIKEADSDSSSSSQVCTKDIYLLLLEDQL